MGRGGDDDDGIVVCLCFVPPICAPILLLVAALVMITGFQSSLDMNESKLMSTKFCLLPYTCTCPQETSIQCLITPDNKYYFCPSSLNGCFKYKTEIDNYNATCVYANTNDPTRFRAKCYENSPLYYRSIGFIMLYVFVGMVAISITCLILDCLCSK